eukprot:1102980-Prorocentrum_minimum.AAC.2
MPAIFGDATNRPREPTSWFQQQLLERTRAAVMVEVANMKERCERAGGLTGRACWGHVGGMWESIRATDLFEHEEIYRNLPKFTPPLRGIGGLWVAPR